MEGCEGLFWQQLYIRKTPEKETLRPSFPSASSALHPRSHMRPPDPQLSLKILSRCMIEGDVSRQMQAKGAVCCLLCPIAPCHTVWPVEVGRVRLVDPMACLGARSRFAHAVVDLCSFSSGGGWLIVVIMLAVHLIPHRPAPGITSDRCYPAAEQQMPAAFPMHFKEREKLQTALLAHHIFFNYFWILSFFSFLLAGQSDLFTTNIPFGALFFFFFYLFQLSEDYKFHKQVQQRQTERDGAAKPCIMSRANRVDLVLMSQVQHRHTSGLRQSCYCYRARSNYIIAYTLWFNRPNAPCGDIRGVRPEPWMYTGYNIDGICDKHTAQLSTIESFACAFFFPPVSPSTVYQPKGAGGFSRVRLRTSQHWESYCYVLLKGWISVDTIKRYQGSHNILIVRA